MTRNIDGSEYQPTRNIDQGTINPDRTIDNSSLLPSPNPKGIRITRKSVSTSFVTFGDTAVAVTGSLNVVAQSQSQLDVRNLDPTKNYLLAIFWRWQNFTTLTRNSDAYLGLGTFQNMLVNSSGSLNGNSNAQFASEVNDDRLIQIGIIKSNAAGRITINAPTHTVDSSLNFGVDIYISQLDSFIV